MFRWLSVLWEPLLDLIGAIGVRDEEAERQANLRLTRAIYDERARKEIEGP